MFFLPSALVLIALALWVAVRMFRSSRGEAAAFQIRFSHLWTWRGAVGRGTYALVGVIGFAIKHNIDRIVATQIFGRRFTPFNYWVPPIDAIRIDRLSTNDARFLATMVAIALPFVWIGLAMTVRRLRSANLPLWPVFLFFVPFVNLAFFAILSMAPAGDRETQTEPTRASALASFIPNDRFGSSAMAVALTGTVGTLATYIGVQQLGTYGWGVFVALPFCFGFVSVLIYSYHQPRTWQSCLAVSMISLALVALALFVFAIEGLICIIMALPIAIPLALLGGIVGFFVQRHRSISTEAPSMMLLLMVFPLGVMTFETSNPIEAHRVSVHTAIRINASSEDVWKNLVEFGDIPEPGTYLFQLGVSYPVRATIRGEGVGAIRECLFSSGTFVEKIDAWERGQRLAFSVVSGPEAMQELSPYEIHPRHLDGYFVPESADFRLIANSDGSTQLESISWYRNSMWPSPYWRLWSDLILHQVHRRVVEHIKTLSERPRSRA